MPLNDIGKFSDFIKGINGVDKSLDVVSQANAINEIIEGISSIDDASKILKLSGVSKEVGEAALKSSQFADSFSKVADATTGITIGEKAVAGLATEGVTATNVFTGLGISIKSAFMALATNPLTYLTAGLVAGGIALHNYITEFDNAVDKAEDSQADYSSTVSELESLNSELETTKSRISELQALKGTGTITDVEDAELTRLQNQNKELERQIALTEKATQQKSLQAANDAKEALKVEKTQDMTQTYESYDKNGLVAHQHNKQTDIITATKNEIAELEKLKKKRLDLLNDDIADTKQTAEFDSLDAEIDKYTNAINSNIESLSTIRKNFEDENGLMRKGLDAESQKYYEAITGIMDGFNNIDLSPAEKELNSLDSFFSSTSGNTLKNYLNNIVSESGNAEDALQKFKSLGLSLDDIGVSHDSFIKYFQDVAKSAEQAKEKVSAVGTTLSDVDKAFESENQDASWKKFADYAAQARDLAKQDKWGTDDLQKSIEWVLPKFSVKKELKKNDDLEYVADVYEKKYKDAEKLYKRYFDAENPKRSAANFQNDLIDKGLLKEDKTGLTGTFDNTAQAAEKMKMSLEATEALLRNLESYGFEWDDVMFSGESLTRYENALNNTKSIRDSMSEGNGKERLNGLIGNWDNEYAKYQNDLSSLSEDQIVHIEFEYNMAQIQSEIDQLQRLANEGDNTAKAALNAKKSEYRDKREKDTGYDESISEGYSNASQKIKDLQSKFGDVKDDNARAKIQDQISAIYDLQNAFQDAFSDNKAVDWDSFLKSTEADKTFKSIEESTGLVRDDISDILDIDPKDIEINAKVNDEATSALESMISISTGIPKEIVTELLAEDKASDETIKVLSEISGIPEEKITKINATDGASGVLTTVLSQITGIPEEKITEFLATDDVSGLAKNVVKETKKIPPKTKTKMTATDGVTPKANSAKSALAGVKDKKITISATVSNTVSNAIAKVKNALGSVSAATNFSKNGGVTKLNGTAHKEGTAKDKTTTLPFSKKGVSQKTGGLHPIPQLSSRALAMGTLEDETWLNPNWKTKKSEVALTGEVGREMVVYGNRWYTVGDNGAEFAHIPAGSVVFNAKQTEELLKNGFTPSRGTARLSGTAHLEGTAYASGNGGRKLTGGSSSKKKSTKSSKSSSKKKSSKKSSKKAAKDAKKAKETFDWIEVAIDRIERSIDSLDLKASSVYRKWSDRNKNLKSEISTVNTEITKQQQGYKRYIKEANKVGLASKWKKKVQDGTIDISTVKDEKLANKIKEYQQWWIFHAT